MTVMRFGGLILQKKVSAEVSWKWYDQSQGIVEWDFKNTGTATASFLLQRGASLAGQQFEDYIFGQAFNVMYLYNGSLFGTSLLQSPPVSLVNNGIETNSPPMAVVDSPGGRFIAFIFTLYPGEEWSMLEGGFQGGITPSNPVLIPVTVKNASPTVLCDLYNTEQCQGYNQQSGSNLPCPPNPWQISAIIMQTDVNVPILIKDQITDGACSSPPPNPGNQCVQQINDGLNSGNFDEVMEGIICLIETFGIDTKALFKKLAARL